jgi:Mrp family chromosome partitioning ATPase
MRFRLFPPHDQDPRSSIAEDLRGALLRRSADERMMRSGQCLDLYGRVRGSAPEASAHIVQFIGIEEGAGTSTIAWEFAQTIASAAARNVLLIHDGYSPVPALQGGEPATRERASTSPAMNPAAQMPAIKAGQSNGHALAQLADTSGPLWRMPTQQVDAVFRTLRAEYDLVVIDSPPLMHSSDGLPVACRLDGVVLVIRAGRTDADLAEAAKRSIEGVGAKLLGVALNTRLS